MSRYKNQLLQKQRFLMAFPFPAVHVPHIPPPQAKPDPSRNNCGCSAASDASPAEVPDRLSISSQSPFAEIRLAPLSQNDHLLQPVRGGHAHRMLPADFVHGLLNVLVCGLRFPCVYHVNIVVFEHLFFVPSTL